MMRRAVQEAFQDKRERIVQPHNAVGPRPDEIADGAIVAFDHPAFGADRLSDFGAKVLGRSSRPVRAPMERIQLDVGSFDES